ncbi:MAG: 3'-5' exonuclease [Odoribacter sp.]|nr:3'-5' exonuclease [Odoribacter sp.]
MERFAAIDFETANWQRTSVCSVGVVVMNRGKQEESFYSLIQPAPNFYSRRNTEIHGLSKADTEDAPAFPTVWREILPLVKGIPLVAHNSVFDEGCLKAVHALYEMDYPDYRFYCTCRLARKYFKGLENYQLHTVSAFCGFDLSHHHNALADAEAAAVIMQTILQRCPEL